MEKESSDIFIEPTLSAALEELFLGSVPFKRAQSLIRTITPRIYRAYSEGENALLFPLMPLANEFGLYTDEVGDELLAGVIRKSQIPIGRVRNPYQKPDGSFSINTHFYAKAYRERIEEVFETHLGLERFRTRS